MTFCPQCGNEFDEALKDSNLTTLKVKSVDKICFSPERSDEDKVFFHYSTGDQE